MWKVAYHAATAAELARLPVGEQAAMLHAVEKLEALGPRLPFPHQSNIRVRRDCESYDLGLAAVRGVGSTAK